MSISEMAANGLPVVANVTTKTTTTTATTPTTQMENLINKCESFGALDWVKRGLFTFWRFRCNNLTADHHHLRWNACAPSYPKSALGGLRRINGGFIQVETSEMMPQLSVLVL